MKHLCGLLLFLLLGSGLTGSAQDFKAAYPGTGTVTLSGNWRFHTSDDMSWAKPTFDESGWETITADGTWGSQTHPGYTGFAWYRRAIRIDGVKGPLSIAMPPVDDIYEIYWNGNKIGAVGTMPPHATWHQTQRVNNFALPAADDAGTLKGELAVRVWKAQLASLDPADLGGLNGPPAIGDSKLIAARQELADARYERSRLIRIVVEGCVISTGLFSLGLWAFDRRRRLNLWLGVFMVSYAAGVTNAFPEYIRFATFAWGQLFIQLTSTGADLGIWALVLVLFGLEQDRFWRRTTEIMAAIYLGANGVDVATIFFWASGWHGLQVIDGVTTAIYSITPLYIFVLLAVAVRRRRELSLLPMAVACVALEGYSLVTGVLGQGVRYTHINLPAVVAAAAFRVSLYTVSLRTQLEAVTLVVMVWTVVRQQALDRRQQSALRAEVQSAKEVQQVLVPEAMEPVAGYAISSLYWPADEVGGDLFQVLPGKDGDALVVLADVSGKGLKAAMTVSVMVGAIRTLTEYTMDPMEILNGLNRRLMGRTNGGFATCVVLHVRADGGVTMGNAGHLAPFLNGEEMSVTGSLPLGVAREAEFEETSFHLDENDEVTLYTDGVLEAQSSSGELYGFDRTKALMKSRPNVQAIAEAAKSFGQKDDVTLVKIARVHEADARPRISVDLQTVGMREAMA